jgi:hypothetical protein
VNAVEQPHAADKVRAGVSKLALPRPLQLMRVLGEPVRRSDMEPGGYKPIRKPKTDTLPQLSVVEDSPQRLVLETRGSRYLKTVVLLTFGAVLLGVHYLSDEIPLWVGLVGWTLIGSGVFSYLNWRRFTFDTRDRIVRFNSVFHGNWVEPLEAIRGTAVETREIERRDESTRVTYTDTLYVLFMIVGSRRVELNQALGGDFVQDLRDRIDLFSRSRGVAQQGDGAYERRPG